eukprot:CFRG1827T1
MVTHFHRPENALKRAKELIDVGKKQSALKALHDVITSKRHKSWTKTSELIQIQFLELCVELRRGKTAKDGLHQYKNMCQHVSIGSLESVIRLFIRLSEQRAEDARSKASESIVDVEDLEADQTPEDLIMATTTSENSQDRTDREVLTPWLKFLWESYRTVLEILRNNPKLEVLYQETAQHAFLFCTKYQRKTEFRRLCEMLRAHLQTVQRYGQQSNSINLANPESLNLQIELRFSQLEAAGTLELWQEAFKSVEDIHGLMGLSKKAPRPQMMAMYFDKLHAVFWQANNHVFHAYAWHRLFLMSKEQKKNLTEEESSRMATNVLLATLCIPVKPEKSHLELDSSSAVKDQRLASLVGLQTPPTRANLINDLKSKNILGAVDPKLRGLFHWVEEEFHPLQMKEKMNPLLSYIESNEGLVKYLAPLRKNVLIRLLQQLSKVYQTMRMTTLCALIEFCTRHDIEKFIVDAVKKNTLQARLNHRSGTVTFGADLFYSSETASTDSNDVSGVSSGGAFHSSRAMQSSYMRDMLTGCSSGLHVAMQMIAPERRVDKAQRKHIAFQKHVVMMAREHKKILERKVLIENRKIMKEEALANRSKAAAKMREAQRVQSAKIEAERLEKESKVRAEEQKARELEAIKAAVEPAQNERDDLLKQVEKLEKEKKDMQGKLKSIERKQDHFERAKRLEEIPLLVAAREKKMADDILYHDSQYANVLEDAKKQHAKNLEMKERLYKMAADKELYINEIKKQAEEEYEQRKKKFDGEIARALAQRRAEHVKQKEQRAEARRQEAARRKEEERLEAEAAERAAIEEAERLAKIEERRAEQAKLDEIANKQREREAEAEARAKERRAKDLEELAAQRAAVRERESSTASSENKWRRDASPQAQDTRGASGYQSRAPSSGAWRRDGPQSRQRDTSPRRVYGRDQDRREFGRGDIRREDRAPPARAESGGGWRKEGGTNSGNDRYQQDRYNSGRGGARGGDTGRDWSKARATSPQPQRVRASNQGPTQSPGTTAGDSPKPEPSPPKVDDDGFTTVQKKRR